MASKAEQKAATHEEILRSAAALLRERGIGGASVADVMRGAGLTVGGFYAHFTSKEGLTAAALRQALGEPWGRLVEALGAVPVEQRRARFVRWYLGTRHRDEAAEGCPIPAVLSELPEQGDEVRAAFAEAFGANARALGEALDEDDGDRVLALITLVVGALTLARALRGSPLSERILRAARHAAQTL